MHHGTSTRRLRCHNIMIINKVIGLPGYRTWWRWISRLARVPGLSCHAVAAAESRRISTAVLWPSGTVYRPHTDRGVARSKKISTFGKPKFEAALNRTSKLRVSVTWRQVCNDLATRRQSLRAMSRMCAGQMHRGCLFPGRMERE